MYHPYFRGKQYELITIREVAPLLKTAGFCPIIEPVREALAGFNKTLDSVVKTEGRAVLVVNPHHGDLSGTSLLSDFLRNALRLPGISPGILLEPDMNLDQVLRHFDAYHAHTPVFIHAGYRDAKGLIERLSIPLNDQSHIFFEASCGKLYQKHFKGANRVLLRDGFKRKRRNVDYDLLEPFSDLHATFADEGMDGFGDFLIVGNDYTESGGPAYAIAIHLTFIDPAQDDSMQIYHFKSKRRDTPKDPAGKFAEALTLMIHTLDEPSSTVLETKAVQEFRMLHRRGHFPGLGYVKKLSMNHHIETLANYFGSIA